MTEAEKNLVKSSFEKIEPVAETVAVLFYARLFEIEPDLRGLFKADLKEQGRKLLLMISMAVKGLDRLDELVPAARALGVRHARYGVEERHYETVAAALLWTLEQVMGAVFTAETRAAWTTVYELLAQTMKDAARPAAATVKAIGALEFAV